MNSNHTKPSTKIFAPPIVLLACMTAAGCADINGKPGDSSHKPVFHEITVIFNEARCPTGTIYVNAPGTVPEVKGDNKDTIVWQSDPADIEYKIVFSPFSVIESGKDGSATGKIKKKAQELPPDIDYKYTIWNKFDCAAAPLDPHIRVY